MQDRYTIYGCTVNIHLVPTIPDNQTVFTILFVLHISDRTYYKVEVQKCSESAQGGRRIR
jgi:hypothetical protein